MDAKRRAAIGHYRAVGALQHGLDFAKGVLIGGTIVLWVWLAFARRKQRRTQTARSPAEMNSNGIQTESRLLVGGAGRESARQLQRIDLRGLHRIRTEC